MKESVLLSNYTTFRIGGPARYFVEVGTVDELKQALAFAHKGGLAVFILGGGSNILCSDSGFSGLVIKIAILGITIEEDQEHYYVRAFAGELWDSFVEKMLSRGVGGLENLSYIPGTVGAAPIQNIGAYGVEVSTFVSHVMALNIETNQFRVFRNEECTFSYRDSFFKTSEGKKYCIIYVGFIFKKQYALCTSYVDVAIKLSRSVPNALDLRNAIIKIRQQKLPDPKNVGSAGSFFQNAIISRGKYEWLRERYPGMPTYRWHESIKVPTAYLIDIVAEMKGSSVGDAALWKNHALVIYNKGSASAHDVMLLAKIIEEKIFELTKIKIKKEVHFIF